MASPGALKVTKTQDKTRTPVDDDGWRIPDSLWDRIVELLAPRPVHPWGCDNPRVR
jgi:hypothetical protein